MSIRQLCVPAERVEHFQFMLSRFSLPVAALQREYRQTFYLKLEMLNCFECAGWQRCGRTQGGLLVLELAHRGGDAGGVS